MDIRRFGIGHRRREGPAGTRGVSGQPIHGDEHGAIEELAFRPHAAIAPHANPNLAYFVVIEGGGFVQVGDEVARVAAGEAVVWPPNVVHAAWTELTPMRAIVVEFATEAAESLLIADGAAAERLIEPSAAMAQPIEGGLAPDALLAPPDRESPEKEPW
ncbi:MAG TPA: cupin domain-containing protein [Candidatus Limnocylindrales bacterium]|jgi:quercetin dioxygenase-like cupin family protein